MIIISGEEIKFNLKIDLEGVDLDTKHELHDELKRELEAEAVVEEKEEKSKTGEKGGEIIAEFLKILLSSGVITAFIKILTGWIKGRKKDVKLSRKVVDSEGKTTTEILEISNTKINEEEIFKYLSK